MIKMNGQKIEPNRLRRGMGGANQMQKRGKDKHFTERGIITQPFTGVIIGLQAVGLFTDEQQGFRGASKPPTDTHQKGPACHRIIFSQVFFKWNTTQSEISVQ